MGFRFRKSIKIGPVRVNFSKKGVGYSVGTKGYRVTKRTDGKIQETYNIPGTGISYVNTKQVKNQKKSKKLFADKDGNFSWAQFIAWIILTCIFYLVLKYKLCS